MLLFNHSCICVKNIRHDMLISIDRFVVVDGMSLVLTDQDVCQSEKDNKCKFNSSTASLFKMGSHDLVDIG